MDLNHCDKWWLAIQVRPRHELSTAKVLHSKGYEEFVPTYRAKRQWSDRHTEIRLPLFTGYVFCKFDAEIRWPIVATPGVIRIVGSGRGIARIDSDEMDAIRAVVKLTADAEPCQHLPLGSRVRVIDGPLAGTEGIIATHKNHRRLVLSLSLIQSSIAVEVDGCTVALVNLAGQP